MHFTTDYADMPEAMAFDELIHHPLYYNYVERPGRWTVVLSNGWYYRGLIEEETGYLCAPLKRLDPCALARFGQ